MSQVNSPWIKTATDQNFQSDVLQSKGVKVVDFWADWCGPCKALSPSIEALAKEYDGAIEVQKLNVDENPLTPVQYGIRGIPTVLIFKDGNLVERIVGNVPKAQLQASIQKQLSLKGN